jgi:hypothetical protein
LTVPLIPNQELERGALLWGIWKVKWCCLVLAIFVMWLLIYTLKLSPSKCATCCSPSYAACYFGD